MVDGREGWALGKSRGGGRAGSFEVSEFRSFEDWVSPLLGNELENSSRLRTTALFDRVVALPEAASDRWRYIRYHDGAEELYDEDRDPGEWTNFVDRSEYTAIKEGFAHWLPKRDAPPAPSKSAYVFDSKEYTWKPKK